MLFTRTTDLVQQLQAARQELRLAAMIEARGMGLEAKTDRIDARLIARYGAVIRPAATPLPDPARLELREILAGRRQLVAEIAVRRQQLEQLRSPAGRARVERSLLTLRQEAKKLDQLLRQQIQGAPSPCRRRRPRYQHARLRPDPRRLPAGRLIDAIDQPRAGPARPAPDRGAAGLAPVARGQPPKLALAALMRKMLFTLNAMMKAKASWKDPRQT